MLHTIFNPCKHIASCCFVRFRSLSATKIHNYFEENNCVNFYAYKKSYKVNTNCWLQYSQ